MLTKKARKYIWKEQTELSTTNRKYKESTCMYQDESTQLELGLPYVRD
jgi:hypothetical protein